MNRIFFIYGLLTPASLGTGAYQIVVSVARANADQVERMFCYRLALSSAAVMCFFTNFVASVYYLAYRRPEADALALATAEVGLAFCSVVLIAGSLGAYYLFGVWWTWSTDVTGALLLCLIYMSYLILRRYANLGQTSVLAAVLGIFAFLDLPLMYVAVAMRNSRASLMAELEPSLHARSYSSLVWSSVAFTVFAAVAVRVRYHAERLEQEADEQETSTIR